MRTHTACKDCGFAHYKDKTQVGCLNDSLKAFEKNGTEIIEAYDDEKEFFIVDGRTCPNYRTKDWFSKLFDNSKNIPTKELYKENKIKVDVIILIGKDQDWRDKTHFTTAYGMA